MSKIAINNQPVLEKIINTINNNSACAQAYLLIGEQKFDLKNYSMLLAKTLICPNSYSENCEKCNICKRIKDGNFAELKIIEPINNVIKKDVILNLKHSLQTNSIEGKNQIYIINDVETLNPSAANSILKFLEEPDSNTVAIFTSTNLNSVMNTIVSRCQIIKINNLRKSEGLDFVCEMSYLSYDQINEVLEIFIELEKDSSIILRNINNLFLNNFNTRDLVQGFLNVLVLIYNDLLNYKFLGNLKYFKNDNRIVKIAEKKETRKIIKKISFILENIEKLDYNVNILLFINNLLIGIGAIDNDKSNRN